MARQTLYQLPHPQLEDWPPPGPSEPLSDEAPRTVFLDACERLAAALAAHGFKYSKSKQRCQRGRGDFTNSVAFQSSHHNVAGRHVQLWMHANVYSKALKAWRSERLPETLHSDALAGGMVHLLGSRYALVQWELADPRDRDATIADAFSFIQQEVFPYFDLFLAPKSLVARLTKQPLEGLDLRSSVEFSYCYGGKDEARLTLDRFVRDRPDLHEAIEAEETRVLDAEPLAFGNYAEQIVFLRKHYRL
jgi:hypothetical protein